MNIVLRAIFAITLFCFFQTIAAQNNTKADYTSSQWYLKDQKTDKVPGISLDQAYAFLAGRKPVKVLVAILDSGLDTAHADIRGNLWNNPDEIPGNGIDDDNNGYIDDIHGWNFLGNAKGENIAGETLEKTRIYRELHPVFGRMKAEEVLNDDEDAYLLYLKAKESYLKDVEASKSNIENYEKYLVAYQTVRKILREHLNKENFTPEDVKGIRSDNISVDGAKVLYFQMQMSEVSVRDIEGWIAYEQSVLDTKLNIDNNPRYLTGDDPKDLNDSIYGNNDIDGGTSGHGTAVAGAVAALRGNGLGIDGIASQVEIMMVRIVPGGDERDKDVALGIRYAVNQGAKIINCSFGKDFSGERWMVDEAIRYAEKHGVLIVHGSGNDGQDNDHSDNYPNPKCQDFFPKAANWIETGASTKESGKNLPAGFSNYGKTTVDLLAPGEDIMALDPGNGYSPSSGTSLAAPVVTGVAALLLSYYPGLTPAEVRKILMESVTPYGHKRVMVPGTKEKTRMKNLCVSGGVLNAYKAVILADQYLKEKK